MSIPLPVDCSELHQQFVDAVLRPAFVQKLWYKLSSFVTFTFILLLVQILFSLLNGVKVGAFARYSVKIRVILVLRLKDEKLINKNPSCR